MKINVGYGSKKKQATAAENRLYRLFHIRYKQKSLALLFSLSKHLPSADTMSFNVDIDELENSHGATYIRKKAAKVIGETLPKEQG